MSRPLGTAIICCTLFLLAGLFAGCQRPVGDDFQANAVTSESDTQSAARAAPDQVAMPECRGKVHLVYLKDLADKRVPGRPSNQFVDTSFLESEARRYRERYGIDVRVRRPMPLTLAEFDAERGQFQDDHILYRLTEQFSAEIADPDAVVIAVMNPDMYPNNIPQWRYVFSMRREKDGLAVIATYRMFDSPGERGDERFAHRVRVMLAKDVGRLLCGFELSEDPQSVMYGKVLGPSDLDQMSDDLRTGR